MHIFTKSHFFKGLFERECQRLVLEWREGESVKNFLQSGDQRPHPADLVINLDGTELKGPRLEARRHLIDVKTVVPGGGYRRAEASTAAHVNWRQAETKDYVRKA